MAKRTRRLLALSWATGLLLAIGCGDSQSGGTLPDASGAGQDTSVGFAPDGQTSGTDDGTPQDVAQPADTTAGLDTSAPEDTPVAPEDTTGPPADAGPLVPEIVVDPAVHEFSYISPLTVTLTRTFTILNAGSATLTVTGVELTADSSPDFSIIAVPPLPMKLAPNDHTLTIVRFQEVAGGTGTLRITSDDPVTPVVEVPLTSFIKAVIDVPVPCVSVQPTSLNFGNVVRGNSKTLPAALVNCSETQPLVLDEITRSSFFGIELSDEMQISPDPAAPVTIDPGQSMPVSVTYTPLLAGPDFGHFIFHTDDPNEPQAKLDVAGVGVAPPIEELGLTIRLTWDADLSDVDSHLIMPGGTFFDCFSDCFFSNPAPDWGVAGDWLDDPFLDLDDVDGFGPEHINISEPMPGTYKYIVHYWLDSYEDSFSTSTSATVEVFNYGTKIAEFGPVYLDHTDRTWDVFTIEWPSLAITELGNTYIHNKANNSFCGFGWP